MVRRLGLGKNNHLTYASLALNPRHTFKCLMEIKIEIVLLFDLKGKLAFFDFASILDWQVWSIRVDR